MRIQLVTIAVHLLLITKSNCGEAPLEFLQAMLVGLRLDSAILVVNLDTFHMPVASSKLLLVMDQMDYLDHQDLLLGGQQSLTNELLIFDTTEPLPTEFIRKLDLLKKHALMPEAWRSALSTAAADIHLRLDSNIYFYKTPPNRSCIEVSELYSIQNRIPVHQRLVTWTPDKKGVIKIRPFQERRRNLRGVQLLSGVKQSGNVNRYNPDEKNPTWTGAYVDIMSYLQKDLNFSLGMWRVRTTCGAGRRRTDRGTALSG